MSYELIIWLPFVFILFTHQDVSCNEISLLPPQIGDLKALRSLNLRRNFLEELPLGSFHFHLLLFLWLILQPDTLYKQLSAFMLHFLNLLSPLYATLFTFRTNQLPPVAQTWLFQQPHREDPECLSQNEGPGAICAGSQPTVITPCFCEWGFDKNICTLSEQSIQDTRFN